MNQIGIIKGSMIMINVYALLMIFIIDLLTSPMLKTADPVWSNHSPLLYRVIIVLIILLVHEYIHVLFALIFVKKSSIKLKFKIYAWICSVMTPMKRNNYILYSVAPGLILSGLSFTGLLIWPCQLLQIALLVSFCGAVGDFWFIAKVLKYPASALVLDQGIEMTVYDNSCK